MHLQFAYRSIILVLLILEFLTLGFKATHEEKIIYEKYHSGLEVDTPVQFHAVSTEVPLYTQTEVQHTMKIRKVGSTTYNVTTYYAYLIVTDENGNQAVVVLSEGFNDLFDTRPFLTPQARQDEAISDLSAEAGDLRDEINGKDGKTFYGVISSNELDQQQVITSNDKKLQKILSLDTLSIYHDEVPETVTVEEGSNVFLRILILIALAAVVVFYLVMRAIIEREQEKVRERERKEKIQRLTQKNPPVEEKEHEQQETSRKQTNEDEVVLQLIEVLKRIKAEKQREAAEKTAQDDKQHKAAEKPVQKAEKIKPSLAPAAKATTQKERKTEMDLSSLHLSETGKQIIERSNMPENLLNLVSQAQVSFEMDFKNSRFHSYHFYTVGCIYYSKHYLRVYVAYRELIGGYGYAWNARILNRYDYNSSDELKAAVIEFITQNGGACTIDQTYIRNCINAAISPDTAQELWKTEKTSEEFPELIKELKEIVAESKIVKKSYTEKEFQRDIERYHLDAFGLSSYTANDYSGACGYLGGVSIRCTPEGDYEVYTVGERGTKEHGTRCETRAEALYAAIHQALGQRSKIEYFERKSREERREREKQEQKAAKKNTSKK